MTTQITTVQNATALEVVWSHHLVFLKCMTWCNVHVYVFLITTLHPICFHFRRVTRYCHGSSHDVAAEFGPSEVFLIFKKETSLTISGNLSEMKTNYVQQSHKGRNLHSLLYPFSKKTIRNHPFTYICGPHTTGIHFELNCVGLRHAIVQIDQYYILNLEIQTMK